MRWARRGLGLVAAAWLLAAGPAASLALDEARKQSGVDRALHEFGLSGQGVLIAVMDRGLDLTHPALRNADGTTRVVGMLDLTDDAGAKAEDNPHRVGTRYTQAQIDEALAAGTDLPTTDAEGRGTASVGIAAGSGKGSLEGAYHGIASKAALLFVKLKSDASPWDPAAPPERRFADRVPTWEQGAPTKGKDDPAPAAEAPSAEQYFDLHRLQVAIDYCLAEAAARKLPCVLVMNFGQLGGPTDGTSALCRKIDSVTGPGKPGLVFVTGASDKGDRENRTKGIVRAGGTVSLIVEKEAHGEVTVDIWYAGDDRLDVKIQSPSGVFGPYKAPKFGTSRYEQDFQYYHLHPRRSTHRPASDKRQIRVDLIGPPARYLIELHGATIGTGPRSGHFDAFIAPNPENPMHEPFNKFVDPTKKQAEDEFFADPSKVGLHGSIWDGATARHAICVGCYVHRTDWTNIQKRGLAQLSEGKLGAIWRGSGRGPTTDGRPGVTLCAPADRIITTYARASEWAESRKHVISDREQAMYGLSSGTTAAAAVVAGVLALMLERNPTLDAAQLKTLLTTTARADGRTGDVPNRTWGHGKLDAYAAIARAAPRAPAGKERRRKRK